MLKSWYISPICRVDSDIQGYHPGVGDGLACPGFLSGMIIHAYDPDPGLDQIPTTCLVGLPPETPPPEGWVPLTLSEAQAHFASVHGYTPSNKEVF